MAEPDDEDDASRQRRNLIVLAAAIVVIAIGWLVIHEIARLSRLQDCEFAGHHNCEQIETTR